MRPSVLGDEDGSQNLQVPGATVRVTANLPQIVRSGGIADEARIYRHWKGNHYVALLIGRDSSNDANREDVVIYLSLGAEHAAGSINVRRVSEFLEEIVLPGGSLAPRFAYVDPAPERCPR